MTVQQELQQSLKELEAALQEPGLTATARKRIQAQIDEVQNTLLDLQIGSDLQASPTIEEQIAAKEREISALRAQLPGYETHPDQWDSQGRLISNVMS